jgi:hypothetical protein
MMKKSMKLILVISGASAIGLSCTACLGTRSATYTQLSGTPPPYYTNSSPEDQSIIRTNGFRNTQVSGTSVITPVQTGFRSSDTPRPLGQVNGIDLTVAQFAQAATQTPKLDLKYRGPPQNQNIKAGYTFVADAQSTGFGLDLALQPHVTVDDEGTYRSTRAGAEVRVGQNLDLRGQNARNSSWYLFAGADGEAVVWDVQRAGQTDIASGQVTLQDKVTVGDVQAGIAFKSPAGQMSISYIERDYEYRNGAISRSGTEEFAAVALTWRY